MSLMSELLDIDSIDDENEEINRTYEIDFINGRISGMIDGLDAVKQSITKTLLTERFKNLIYTAEYGCEIKNTLMSPGNTDEYLNAEIPALIKEALLQDNRILSVDNIKLDYATPTHDSVRISFDVTTIYGNMKNMEGVV